jgi:hypothetical protein
MERKLNRQIFENAIESMKKYGKDSMMSPRIFSKRHGIKNSLLVYYESTEEFEKCKFVIEFFTELETHIMEMVDNESVGATGEFELIK